MPGPEQSETPPAPATGGAAPASFTAAQIADLAWAGQHEQAVALCTQALERARTGDAETLVLLALRSESLLALGRFAEGLADADAMRVRAGGGPRGRGVAAAHSAHAYALTRLGRRTEAPAAGDAAVLAALARGRTGADDATLALALLRRGEARYFAQQAESGLEDGRRSLALFERLADLSGQARALWVVGANLISLGQVLEAQQAVARGLAFARACGDNLALGQLLNLSVFWNSDPTANVRALRDARSAFQRAGRLDRLVVIESNLASTFDQLGLPRRALRLLEQAKQRALAMGSHQVLEFILSTAAAVAVRLGRFDDAHRLADELGAVHARLKRHDGPAHLAQTRAFIALEEGRAALAVRLLTPRLASTDETAGIGNRLELKTNLA